LLRELRVERVDGRGHGIIAKTCELCSRIERSIGYGMGKSEALPVGEHAPFGSETFFGTD
jgi:hypothetical protein